MALKIPNMIIYSLMVSGRSIHLDVIHIFEISILSSILLVFTFLHLFDHFWDIFESLFNGTQNEYNQDLWKSKIGVARTWWDMWLFKSCSLIPEFWVPLNIQISYTMARIWDLTSDSYTHWEISYLPSLFDRCEPSEAVWIAQYVRSVSFMIVPPMWAELHCAGEAGLR